MTKFLITGSANGLGRHLWETLGGIGFDRKDYLPKEAKVIIHCAFNSARLYMEKKDEVDHLILEDIRLVKMLTDLPHSYFIFISSIDVLNNSGTAYAFAKMEAEKIVKNHAVKYLIIRPSALLGKYSRMNSLMKIIEGDCKLSLTPDSIFNYIRYEDITKFIKFGIKKRLEGTFQLASSENITLEQAEKIIRDYLGETAIRYGDYHYSCGDIDISDALKTKAFPKKTSAQVVDEFINII